MISRFKLLRGGVFLGEIEHTEDDFPNHIGIFTPEEAFDEFRFLFEEELRLLREGRLDEWRQVRKQIESREIILEPQGPGMSVKNPLVHIEGERVWWR
jgi:hypothetical protein